MTRVRRLLGWARENWGRVAAAAALLLVFFGNAGFRGLVGNWRELRRLEKDVARLEREEKELETRLKALRAGDGGVERLARRELGYIKKGEIEYRFDPPTK